MESLMEEFDTPDVEKLDKRAMEKAKERLNRLAKPENSLGKLEDICEKMAGIQSSEPSLQGKKIFVLAADHGVVEEGISAYPGAFTGKMVRNFLEGGAAINSLAEKSGAKLEIVDVGVRADFEHEGLRDRKIRRGTRNFLETEAMTSSEAIEAIEVGIELVENFGKEADVIGLGEMGIGNTTSSAAIICSILDEEPEEIVGSGTGLDKEGVERKTEVVRKALERHDPEGPIKTLEKVGGYEIAGLTGLIIGAAANKKIVVVDGYITAAAALLALEIEPLSLGYMVFSHRSDEQGFEKILEVLDSDPLLDLDMKLGEGTGSALAMNVVESAVKVYQEMEEIENL